MQNRNNNDGHSRENNIDEGLLYQYKFYVYRGMVGPAFLFRADTTLRVLLDQESSACQDSQARLPALSWHSHNENYKQCRKTISKTLKNTFKFQTNPISGNHKAKTDSLILKWFRR